jgi:hypothetical protein
MILNTFRGRSQAFRVLDANRLRELVDLAKLTVSDRRSRDVLIQALADGRRIELATLVGHLSREELKAMCRALGLPDDGREKAVIIERLMGPAGTTVEDAPETPQTTDGPTEATAPWRTQVIELLKRDELNDVIDDQKLVVGDRRVLNNLREAVDKSSTPLTLALERLPRARLKELCRVLGLDDGGKEKAPIIERLAREAGSEEETGTGTNEVSDKGRSHVEPQALIDLLGAQLSVESANGYWPATGTLLVANERLAVDIYARGIGATGRNPLERRFQNPGTGVPINPTQGRPCLLLGVWMERGPERAVLVAFDAYRRRDKTTRVSHFMSLSLLEEAADTGFVRHETTSGEIIYAFRPDLISRYMDAFAENATWGEYDPGAWATKKTAAPTPSSQPAAAPGSSNTVEIRPKAGMFAAFARLNYKPWFALAELVDNAVQSFLSNREKLAAVGNAGPLIVDINLEADELSVTDRAAGIHLADFPRAFSPAMPPGDATGLSEFGLGMKAAASWFAREWSVRTSALGEPVERTISFDVPKITKEGLDFLPIQTRPARPEDHYTVVRMRNLRVRPRGSTLGKIKEHLASIYRLLIADGTVTIRLTSSGKTEELAYAEPKLLKAPYYAEPNGPVIHWRREIEVTLEDRRVTGWAGILESGKHALAGFSVFRRRRLIEGSVGEAYRHRAIFGAHNSFASQRLVGELYVEGFDVTHTKDGIQWGDDEDGLAYQIRLQLEEPLPILDQANGYRAKKTAASLPGAFGGDAIAATATAVQGLAETTSLGHPNPANLEDEPPKNELKSGATTTQHQQFRMRVDGDEEWEIYLELIRDPAADWLDSSIVTKDGLQYLQIRINLDHPFSEEHLNDNERALDPVLRLAVAIALGERQARIQGVKNCTAVRRNANELLKTGLSSAMTPKGDQS